MAVVVVLAPSEREQERNRRVDNQLEARRERFPTVKPMERTVDAELPNVTRATPVEEWVITKQPTINCWFQQTTSSMMIHCC